MVVYYELNTDLRSTSEYFTSDGPYILTTPGHFKEEGGFRDLGEKTKFYKGAVPKEYILSPGNLLVVMTEQKEGLVWQYVDGSRKWDLYS